MKDFNPRAERVKRVQPSLYSRAKKIVILLSKWLVIKIATDSMCVGTD